MKKLLFLAILSGCANNPDGYMYKSSGGKMFDFGGYNKSKRRPTFNEKYIEVAKKNVTENHIDYEDVENFDEIENPADRNKEMYFRMAKRDKSNESPRYSYQDVKSRKRIPDNFPNNTQDYLALREELEKIKQMISDTSKEYNRCPMTEVTTQNLSNNARVELDGKMTINPEIIDKVEGKNE